jgi:poly(A) polymerase
MTSNFPGLRFPDIVHEVQALLPESSNAYLVGGVVRDTLLHRPVHDIDITLAGDGVAAARRLAEVLHADYFPLDAERGVGRVLTVRDGARLTIDFATQRGADILTDLTCRDFTINAIAIPLHHWDQAIDPLSGASDLQQKQIRACSDTSIQEDPARSIRAVRLAVQLDFAIEPSTRELVRAGSAGLIRISAERIRDEFFRILAGRKIATAVRVAKSLGIIDHILPEADAMEATSQPPPHRDDVWNHSLCALEKLEALTDLLTGAAPDEASNNLIMGLARVQLGKYQAALGERLAQPRSDDRSVRGLLAFAALLHDAGKPYSRSVDPKAPRPFEGHELLGAEIAARRATELRFSNEEVQFLAAVVRNHVRPLHLQNAAPITRRAIFRFFRAAGASGIETSLLALADTLATFGPSISTNAWSELLQMTNTLWDAYFEHEHEMVHPSPLLSGNDLIRDFLMAPGPAIGDMLDTVREAQAAGEIITREEALAFVTKRLGGSSG